MSLSSGFYTRTIQREHITNFCLRTSTVLASTVEKKPSFAMKLDLKVELKILLNFATNS